MDPEKTEPEKTEPEKTEPEKQMTDPQAKPAKEPEGTKASSQPDQDFIKQITANQEALAKEAKALWEENKKINDSTKKRDEALRRALFPEEQKSINPIHEAFLNDPDGLVEALSEISEERVMRKLQASNKQVDEVKKAANKVLGERPDISGDQTALEVFTGYYRQAKEAAPDSSDEEAMTAALKKFDQLADKYGFEARLKEQRASVGSPSRGGGQQSFSSPERAKDMRKIFAESLEQEKERKLKARNRITA